MTEEKTSQTPAAEPAAEAPKTQPQPQQPTVVRKKFPTVGDIFAMLGILLGAQILVGLITSLVRNFADTAADATSSLISGKFLFATYTLSMVLSLAGILALRRGRGGNNAPLAQFSLRGLNPVLLVWAFVLMCGIGVVLEPITEYLPGPPLDNIGSGFWTIVSLIVMAPLFEELICRGILLGAMRAKYGVVIAWLVSSLFFGVIHIYPAQVVSAFAMGLILGYIYIATDSLWAAMILHALNNAVAYVAMQTGHAETALSEWVGNTTWYVVIYIVALAVTAVSGYMVYQTLSRLKAEEKNRVEA